VTVTEVPRSGVDDERFSLLFYAHAARLVRLAMLLGAGDPEDVVQEAFCRVFAARGRVRGDDDQVRAYLRRAVVNEVRDRHRRRQVATSSQHLLVVPLTARDDIAPDERDAVLRAVQDLPPRQREALVLRFWLDLPLAEVAEAMGTRLGTAKAHVSRALATITEALSGNDEDGRRTP
jgi:RNA polymerase sigma factor (sigma-70 family)